MMTGPISVTPQTQPLSAGTAGGQSPEAWWKAANVRARVMALRKAGLDLGADDLDIELALKEWSQLRPNYQQGLASVIGAGMQANVGAANVLPNGIRASGNAGTGPCDSCGDMGDLYKTSNGDRYCIDCWNAERTMKAAGAAVPACKQCNRIEIPGEHLDVDASGRCWECRGESRSTYEPPKPIRPAPKMQAAIPGSQLLTPEDYDALKKRVASLARQGYDEDQCFERLVGSKSVSGRLISAEVAGDIVEQAYANDTGHAH